MDQLTKMLTPREMDLAPMSNLCHRFEGKDVTNEASVMICIASISDLKHRSVLIPVDG